MCAVFRRDMPFLFKDMQALASVNNLCVEDCTICIGDEVGDDLCTCRCREAYEDRDITLARAYASDRSSCSEKLACTSLSKSSQVGKHRKIVMLTAGPFCYLLSYIGSRFSGDNV